MRGNGTKSGAFVLAMLAACCGDATGPAGPPSAPPAAPAPAPSEAPPVEQPGTTNPDGPPHDAGTIPETPSVGRLGSGDAFGSDFMIPGAYVDEAAMKADPRDGVLELEIVDGEDGTPVRGARVAGQGALSGDRVEIRSDARGIARFEGAPRVWLGVVVDDGARDLFASRHASDWRLVHGPGRVRIALARTRWFRFRLDLPHDATPPERVEVRYERQGTEGLGVMVPSLAGGWNLREDSPRAIALPSGPCRVEIEFPFRDDLPLILVTDVVAGGAEQRIRLLERVPVTGTVVEGDPASHGAALDSGATLEIEMRRRSGDFAFESVRFRGDGEIRSVTSHGDAMSNSWPPVASIERGPGGVEFRSPVVAPGATYDIVARALDGDTVVAAGFAENVVAGRAPARVPLLPAATIRGVVRDASGAPLATPVEVTASWASEAPSRGAVIAATMSGPDGRFELSGLPHVPVRVVAGGPFHAVFTPEPVLVTAGDVVAFELATRPTMTVRGVVRDAATKRPVACHLAIQQPTTHPSGHSLATHGDGKFVLHGLVPGAMRVVLLLGGDRVAELEPVTITGTECDLELRLR